jgi:signal transduction histidine kinase
LNAFYKQCIAEQHGLAKLKNVEITEDYASEEVIKKIDEGELKRAVQNIISNAIKFSHPFGKIKVSTKHVGENLILKISDAGIGIPLNLQPYVFHKFSSAQRAGTNGEMSTGLGLYFAKQCVISHRGTIYFKSTDGKGTKFYITL